MGCGNCTDKKDLDSPRNTKNKKPRKSVEKDEELKQDYNDLVNDEMDFQIRPINDPLDDPDINADIYESFNRRDGNLSLRPLILREKKMKFD